jgi:glycosyltransferase involved in cell wall biosynthesis
MKGLKLLSLVVPAYKQEKTIIEDIKNLDKVLSSFAYEHEIIVVVDGFLDKTYDVLKDQKSKIKNLKLLGYEKNHGKGYAVKLGMLKARGDVIGFIDAGMDIKATGVSILLDSMLWQDADIMVGSKLHPDSKVDYPVFRKILSWGYRALTRVLFGFSIRDTQVGLKFFRREVVEKVFPKLLVENFAFDVEILAVARAFGYKRIYEGPIELTFRGGASITSSNFWKIVLSMLWDTAGVFYRLQFLNTDRKK